MKLTTKKLYELIRESINQNKDELYANNLLKLFFGKGLVKLSNEPTEAGKTSFWDRVKVKITTTSFDGSTQHPFASDFKGERYIFALSIDNQVAAMVEYQVGEYEKFKCAPEPGSSQRTWFLTKTARSPDYKGLGAGKLINFLSAVYITDDGDFITSDRDTSVSAGRNLVNSLKLFQITKSEPFDYVGYLKKIVEESMYFKMPERKWHNTYSEWRNILTYHDLINRLHDHLTPLTEETGDDCPPSVNMFVGQGDIQMALEDYEDTSFANKLLSMSSDEIQDLLNSDPNVMGFRFNFSNQNLVRAGMWILDHTYEVVDDQEESIKFKSKAYNLFDKVYEKEVLDQDDKPVVDLTQ